MSCHVMSSNCDTLGVDLFELMIGNKLDRSEEACLANTVDR